MDSNNLINLMLRDLNCNQKELANKLGVSPTQITKWKNNEHMSEEFERKIKKILNLGDLPPQLALLAGSVENAKKWQNVFSFLAINSDENAETGYNTEPFLNEQESMAIMTLTLLKNELGIEIPKKFPKELDFQDPYNENNEIAEQYFNNHIVKTISNLFDSYAKVWAFFYAYIYSILNDQELGSDIDELVMELEKNLLYIAAMKLDNVDSVFEGSKNKWEMYIYNIIEKIKTKAYEEQIPLPAELMDILYDSDDELRDKAEYKAFGFDKDRIHPDIYMNELLTGMRAIHVVLPAIMEKLGMEDKLDFSQVSVNKNLK